MRVAFVVTGGFDRSGRERIIPSLVWLVERLARRHDVFVYVLRYHDTPCRYELAGATIHDLGSPRGPMNQAVALWRALRRDGPFDVVHAYWAQPARIAAPLARTLRIPVVVTFDSGEFVSLPRAGYGLQSTATGRLGVAAASRFATRVTVCSGYQAALARTYGVDATIVPLGVDTSLFAPRSTMRSGPPFRLLHVASLNPVKDQATLVRAVRTLLDRDVDVALDIVGEDTMGGQLQQLVGDLHLEPHVTFHGFLPSERLVELYHRADLFVLTSLHEAAGVVLLEAASCGVPVVGSNVGYIADWAPDGAVAVPAAAPDALASAIADLLFDPDRRQAIAACAQTFARAHDADWSAHRFEEMYAEVVTLSRYADS